MPLPLPNLDDKTFDTLVEEATGSIPRHAPEWTDHNQHDPGITFIELFAWLAEMQQYYQNRVRNENFLKFLKLLGVKPKAASSATTDVSFSLQGDMDGVTEGVLVPQGTKLRAAELVFETESALFAVPVTLTKILSSSRAGLQDNTEANAMDGLSFFAFGEKAETGSRFYLGFDSPFPVQHPIALTFELFEDYPVAPGRHADEPDQISPSALISWEYYNTDRSWVPLEILKDGTLMLSHSGRMLFTPPSNMQERIIRPFPEPHYWLRATVRQAGYELPPQITTVQLNTVCAIERETLNEVMAFSSNGLPHQTLFLDQTPIIPESLTLQVQEEVEEEEMGWRDWVQVEDFDASKPDNPHYVLNSETGEIHFGDGVNGDIPPALDGGQRKNIRVTTYQVGGGARGNVPAGAITKIDEINKTEQTGDSFSALHVENRRPASGGTNKETLEEAKTRARRDLKTRFRAVSSEDFEYLARATPGLRVARAKAIPLFSPGLQHYPQAQAAAAVTIVVVPYSLAPRPTPSEGFLLTVCRHLDRHRLITTQLHVIAPDYVRVNVQASILLRAGFDPTLTQSKVEQRLSQFLHPLEGGPDRSGWPFGRAVYKSEIYQLLENIEDVDCVEQVRLSAEGVGVQLDTAGNIVIPPHSLVYSGDHQIEILSLESECRVKGRRRP